MDDVQVQPRAAAERDSHRLLELSYVLPIAASASQARKLTGYLLRLSRMADDVIVVDGSPAAVFASHARAWSGHLRHIRPQLQTPMGKVGGVMTGIREARYERVVVADEDVRYRHAELERIAALLDDWDVVRPQNWFRPLPWHARWDSARSLLNRLTGGDWPGTLGVRRSKLLAAGGYAGDVMFENLEMVRTVEELGGREKVPLDLLVVRRPPPARHFLSQRVRQAYDEWARPTRFAAELALLPGVLFLLLRRRPDVLLALTAFAIGAAEMGRRKGDGRRVFPGSSAFWAPAWLGERAVTSWLALGTRLLFGGIRYRSIRLTHAATPRRKLRARLQGQRQPCVDLPPFEWSLDCFGHGS